MSDTKLLKRCKKYNITLKEYERFLELQDNKCAICLQRFTKTPNIDHCHTSGLVRGLLCARCNMVLGTILDNNAIAGRLSKYIIRANTIKNYITSLVEGTLYDKVTKELTFLFEFYKIPTPIKEFTLHKTTSKYRNTPRATYADIGHNNLLINQCIQKYLEVGFGKGIVDDTPECGHKHYWHPKLCECGCR